MRIPPNIVDLVYGTTQEKIRTVSNDDILKFIWRYGTRENDVAYVRKICNVSDFGISQRCYVMNIINMVRLLNSNGMLDFITYNPNCDENEQFIIKVNIGIDQSMFGYDELINSLERITDSSTLNIFVQLTGEI